ncbi:hypothetical protein [Microvirga sp. VF16]|uniref:hypothetical protein n=1 Tax=Microvirga sp. VF16 TaxID=2807101 RepID=UPI00193E0E0C|nr:hypothetical protein [Microvirga sp. VF16]QRM35147.1 hypothetical protein JO965_39845 [Microvirga sp. VF16]
MAEYHVDGLLERGAYHRISHSKALVEHHHAATREVRFNGQLHALPATGDLRRAPVRRAPLTGRRRGAGVPLSPHELNGETIAATSVPGRRPAGVARPDTVYDRHPAIEKKQ